LEKEHDGRWSVELDEEPRVHTWGKTIDQASPDPRSSAMWFETDEPRSNSSPAILPKTTGRTVEQAATPRTSRKADRLA